MLGPEGEGEPHDSDGMAGSHPRRTSSGIRAATVCAECTGSPMEPLGRLVPRTKRSDVSASIHWVGEFERRTSRLYFFQATQNEFILGAIQSIGLRRGV